ncbi:Pentatricopeptide repeat-containing protein [Nymphaea thermarum]|nr:Pentatricopeptide repeat-containing protein [Nymphaea thermarum]
MKDADDLFEKMQSGGLCPDNITFTMLTDGHCKEGNVMRALQLHEEMLQKGLLPGVKLIVASAETAYNGHCGAGNTVKALDLYKKLNSAGFVPNMRSVIALIIGLHNQGMSKDCGTLSEDLLRSSLVLEAEISEVLVEMNHKEGDMHAVVDVLMETTNDGLASTSKQV